MARYIDVEGYRKLFDEEYKKTRKLISNGETHLDNLAEGFSEASRVIDGMPTADVVPKSEVDRLVDKWIGEENLTQDAMVLRLIEALRDEAKRYEKYYFNHEYDKLIAEAKQEVAREIFEELDERFVYTDDDYYISFPYYVYDELQKKYTEGKNG